MKVRFNRVPLYLTLALVPLAIVGCGESKNKDLSVNPSPQPSASAPFPSPSVPPTLNSPSKVALTRPTNPDDRLRVIKSGRPDPFGSVGPVASLTSANVNSGSGYYYSQQPSSNRLSIYDRYLKGANGSSSTPSSSSSGSLSFPPSRGQSVSQSGGLSGSMPDLTLPSLPKAPEPAGVKVSGILVVGGEPRAIVQAPDEPTSRTVGIGDSLSGGKLFVKNIDTSSRTEPKVIFQQGDFEFSVAVGRDPVLTASAMPSSPLGGLTLPKLRP
jgi:hypothetical protein